MSQGQTSQRLRPFKPLRFGRYTLLLPLSTGGMGEIFLARLEGSHGFDKLCVIKKILPHLAQDQQFVSRFVDEAHILVKLSHGNVAQVLDMGVHDGAPYIALEFVDGKDLRRVLQRMRERQLPLPLSFVLSVMTRVLDALAYAHRKRDDQDHELNLVHRDVSPQNVLISYEGEVKVIDFGLAKSAMSVSRTNPSIVMGKFMYMAPEQARHKQVDRRSDLYAVGLCLWELVAGKNPFDDVPPGELISKVGNPTIAPLNQVEPLCPLALSEAVGKALAVDPAQRFQTAEEFRAKLQAILQQIDPQAGAESTSRFMRDAFSGEYQFERRMLTSVKEQARALDEAEPPNPSAEETMDNVPSPFANGVRPTPMATPAVRLADEPTPLGRPALEGPTPLSFQPTRKTSSGLSKAHRHEDHEKETLPSIQLKTELSVPTVPLVAPAPAPAPEKIRARVLAKSFDQEATEASTPAIAEPERLPSIMIDGLPSEPVRTELEVPAQFGPPPSPPAAKAKPTKPKAKKPKAREPLKPEKTGEKSMPRAVRPATPPPVSMPARTDTQVLPQVSERAPAAARAAASSNRWLWFAVPVIAVVGLGGFIAFDMHLDAQRAQQEAEAEPPPEAEAPVDAPKQQDLAAPPPPEKTVEAPAEPVKEAPKKKPLAAPQKVAAKTSGSPGEAALGELKGDFARLVDEAVQRKFRLQVNALESQLDEKGSDPAYVEKVERLHAQIKTALAQQQ